MKIWLGKAESSSARSSHTLSKPLKTKETRRPCCFTDSSVIANTDKMTINITEPVPWFVSSVPLLLWHCRSLSIFPRQIQENHSVRAVKIEFQYFHYSGKISFSQASSHNSLRGIKLLLSGAVSFSDGISQIFISLEFLSLLHLVSIPGSWLPAFPTDWHEDCPQQNFFEVINISDSPSVLIMNNFSSLFFVQHISPIYSPAEMLHLFTL